MALTGSYFDTTSTLDNNVSHSIEITYPSDLPSDSIFYDKRGTTETSWETSSVFTTTEYPSAYAMVRSAVVHKQDVGPHFSHYALTSIVNVYTSSEDRTNALEPNFILGPIWDINDIDTFNTGSENIITLAYEYLKQEPAFVSMSLDN